MGDAFDFHILSLLPARSDVRQCIAQSNWLSRKAALSEGVLTEWILTKVLTDCEIWVAGLTSKQ